MGYQAGYHANNVCNSNFLGYQAGYYANNACYSNFLGYQAGKSACSSPYSTFIGYNAGSGGTGSNNVIIGTNISLFPTCANMLNIGGVIFACGLHSTTTGYPICTAVSGGKVGINTETPSTDFHVCGYICVTEFGPATDWIATSDCRLKKDIRPITCAISKIEKLNGVCYRLCSDDTSCNRIGLIAQDVLSIVPEVVACSISNYDDCNIGICDYKYGIAYDKLTALLIEAVKEQQIEIGILKNEIDNLKNLNVN